MTVPALCGRGLFVLIAAVAACDKTPGALDSAFATSDSAGVIFVDNRSPEWTDSTHWRVDSVPITSIGGDSTDIQQQFKYTLGAVRYANGNVLVATQEDVRLFGSDGKFIHTVVRNGSGPGEARSVNSLVSAAGDTVLVSQMYAGVPKITVLNPDATFAREEVPDLKRRRKLGRWGECRMPLLPDHSQISCTEDPSIPITATNRESKETADGFSSPGPGLLRQLRRQYVIPFSQDTAYPISVTAGIEQFGIDLGGRTRFFVHRFHSAPFVAAGGSPMRIFTILNPEYRIEVWTPKGKLERVVRRVDARRVPTKQEIEDARDELMKVVLSSTNDDKVAAAKVVDAVPTPDSLPASMGGITVAQTGELFVPREGWLPSQTQSIFDIFNANGRWLGELRLPPRTGVYRVGPDYLLIHRLDESDVPYVEVLRLHKPLESNRGTNQ